MARRRHPSTGEPLAHKQRVPDRLDARIIDGWLIKVSSYGMTHTVRARRGDCIMNLKFTTDQELNDFDPNAEWSKQQK